MSEERKRILNMVAEGKITPEEADRLLGALKDTDARTKFFRVRIFDRNSDRPKVKVDIPISVLKLASKMGAVFKGMVPEGFTVNVNGKEMHLDEFSPEVIDQVVDDIAEGGRFMLAQVTDEEKNEYVEVYIE